MSPIWELPTPPADASVPSRALLDVALSPSSADALLRAVQTVAPSTVITLRKRAYLKLAEAGLPSQRLGLARLLNRCPLRTGRIRRKSLTVPLEGDIGAFTRA